MRSWVKYLPLLHMIRRIHIDKRGAILRGRFTSRAHLGVSRALALLRDKSIRHNRVPEYISPYSVKAR
jgi:hypothetical protein